MTREMNKPDWCNYDSKRDDIWKTICEGCPLILYDCLTCVYYKDAKPKPRTLNPDVAEFVNELNERLGQK